MKKKDHDSIRSSKLPTTGRIGRIAKIMISTAGLFAARKVMKGVDKFDRLNYSAKADYIRDMVTRMKRVIGTAKTTKILVSCGMMCCGITHRKIARQLMQESKSLKDFISRINKRHIGGGRLKLHGANTIIGGYDRCYCGMVSKTRTPFPDLTYCRCSTGWYKRLFESALGHPVKVEILKSIISGASTCEFVIKIL